MDKMEKMRVVSVSLLLLFFHAKVSYDVFSCVYLNWREFVLQCYCKYRKCFSAHFVPNNSLIVLRTSQISCREHFQHV